MAIHDRLREMLCLLAIAGALNLATPAAAQSPRKPHTTQAAQAARRNLEIAQLRLQRYMRFEYPLEKQRLESAIKITKAEIEMFSRQVDEYKQFTKFKYSAPLMQSLEHARLNRLKARTALDDLYEEKRLKEHDRRRQTRLLELEVEAAAEYLDRLLETDDKRPTSSRTLPGRVTRRPLRNSPASSSCRSCFTTPKIEIEQKPSFQTTPSPLKAHTV